MNTDEFKDRTTVVCHMRPRPEKTAQFRASLMALVQPTRAEPGSLAYELYEEPDGGLLLIETWALPDQPPSPSHDRHHDEKNQGDTMKFTQSGGRTATGPADWFSGTVYIDGVRNPDDQSAVGCSHVRFTPGARTAWHHHPKGQTLYVTDGIGYVARRGDDGGSQVQEIRPGDVVYIEPGEEHWHGATPDRFMAHVAIQEADDSGQVVTWLNHVSDAEYGA